MTTAEYLQTPETTLPSELVFGQLRVAEAPSTSHQRVVQGASACARAGDERI